jgi:hypothetical protein
LPLAYADGLVSPKNPLTFHSFRPLGDHHLLELGHKTTRPSSAWPRLRLTTIPVVVDQGGDGVRRSRYQVVSKEFFERGLTGFNPPSCGSWPKKPHHQCAGPRGQRA